MSPPKNREQITEVAVLSQRVNDLDGRVRDLEEADQQREDSNAGIRKELADHRIEDAQTATDLKIEMSKIKGEMSLILKLLFVLLGLAVANGLLTFLRPPPPQQQPTAAPQAR